MTKTLQQALEAVGLDRPIDEKMYWQPHELPPGSPPPSSLAGQRLDPEEIVPGLVALRMDPALLIGDDGVDTPKERERLGIGPFLCLEVAADGSETTWAALSRKVRHGRLDIDPGWRRGGNSRWRRFDYFLLDTDTFWIGPKQAFIAAAWREALSDVERAHLTADGLQAVRDRVLERRRLPTESIPVDWEAVARAQIHPLQISILELLGIDGGRVLSPTDLSKELQIPLSNTSYHVTALKEKPGLIVLSDTKPMGSTMEHFYRQQLTAPGWPPFHWEELARIYTHALWISILEILGMDGGRVLSPNDISQEMQLPLSNVSHHVRRLTKAGLIFLTDTKAVRGATEHFYALPEKVVRTSQTAQS